MRRRSDALVRVVATRKFAPNGFRVLEPDLWPGNDFQFARRLAIANPPHLGSVQRLTRPVRIDVNQEKSGHSLKPTVAR
jgi:hypothetical protein